MLLTDEAMRERMVNGWRQGLPFTSCGNGSTLEHTRNPRKWLPSIVQKYDARTVCDAGCGDLAWIKLIDWQVEYRPFDLIPRRSDVMPLDITRQALPSCDLILCRFVLNHLGDERTVMAINLFRQSAKYLIATQFDAEDADLTRQFARLDLRREPFNLGEPVEWIQDASEQGCKLALWRLSP